ncbi:MAG: SusC/RagA family TonB-linked outer membrane protein [Bacteroidota bacterium]
MILQKRLTKTLLLALLLFMVNNVFSQKTISGKVLNDRGAPLNNATVLIKGNNGPGVKTNDKGEFSIAVSDAAQTLIISYIGHGSKEVSIVGKNSVEVSLPLLAGTLDTVVAIGYGTKNRKDVTGAISSVKGEDIKNLPSQNVAEALQGRMAGIEVVKESAEPGGNSAQITIRGVSSLSQPDPLYVIDGVIQKNKGGANINNNDIATIDVLKDASAAAIYGASAAGGVIIITTKRGASGTKPTINFNARYGITKPLVYDLLNKEKFLEYKTLTRDPYYANPNNAAAIAGFPDYDWVDALYSNGVEQNYNLSLSGKTSGVDYFVSGVYNKQKGIFLDNSSDYGAIRINTDVKLSDKIKIGEQINAWHRSTSPVKTSTVITPFRTAPTGQAYSGNVEFPWGDFPAGYQGVNLMAQIKTAKFDFPEYNFQGNAYIEIKLPPKYMTFKATVGYTYAGYENNIYRDVYNTSVTPLTINSLYRSQGKYEQLLNAFILAYDHTYGGIHTLNLLAGYENYTNKTSNLTTNVTSVAGTSYGYIPTSGSTFTVNGGYDPQGLVRSYFGRLNYDFDKKLIATFTVRDDANYTTFGPTNQHGIFPSASIAWKLDKERFFRNLLPNFGQFKLRAGYGSFGNSSIDNYQYTTSFARAGYQNFSNGGTSLAGYTQELIANRDVRWETLQETNIGIDADAYNGKLYFTVDWYSKRTKDMLYWVPVPPSVGIPPRYDEFGNEGSSAIIANIGEVKNTGVDILLGYRNKYKKLNYNLSFTGSFNKNTVVNLDGVSNAPIKNLAANSNFPATNNSLWVNQPLTYTAVDLPFGQFYGYKSLGIFQTDEEAAAQHATQPRAQAGDLHFQDTDGNGVLNDDDKVVIGNPYPKFSYGFTAGLGYKQFDMSLLFNGVMGVDIYNGVAPYTMSLYDGGNLTDKVFNASFLGENGLTSQPRIGQLDGSDFERDPNGNYAKASSYFVENGSYLKLKNIQIGYALPESITKKFKLKNTRFFVMGNNVFAITKYSGIDPEIGGSIIARGIDRIARYPNARTYSVGIDITL